MLTLDYNTVISYQAEEVEKSKRRLDFIHTPFGKWINSFFSLNAVVGSVNRIITSQLLKAKGLHAELNDHYTEISEKDCSRAIHKINDLLNLNIAVHSLIEEILKEESDRTLQKLAISEQYLQETIETLYSIIRLLKRANQKKPLAETSQLAIDSSKKSIDTLSKVVYDHKY